MSDQGSAETIEALLDRAEEALEEGKLEVALEICEQVLRMAPGHAGAWFVQGDALRALGRLEDAAESYRSAALRQPDHAASWSSLALTCFELLRFDEARRAASRAVREAPDTAEAWWVRALIRERNEDLEGAERAQIHASWLDPEGFPLPPRLSDEDVEDIVEETLTVLHPTLREYLANVPVLLEETPSEDMLRLYDPPANPLELLGFFSGTSLQERSLNDPWSQLPGTITLFRKNLERHAESRGELIEELRITLFHEVGHFLGLDEDDLEARGLD